MEGESAREMRGVAAEAGRDEVFICRDVPITLQSMNDFTYSYNIKH